MSKSTALPAVHWIAVVNGCLDRHGCLLHSPVEKLKLLETFKNKLASPTSIHEAMAEIYTPKKVQTNGWTDGFSALYSRYAHYLLSYLLSLSDLAADNFAKFTNATITEIRLVIELKPVWGNSQLNNLSLWP